MLLRNKFYMNEFNMVKLLIDGGIIWIISYTKTKSQQRSHQFQ